VGASDHLACGAGGDGGLGEILIYFSFAMLAMHWLPYVILAGFVLVLFLPNMRRKDASLSRHQEFEAYRQHSGLLLPRLLP
jgi:protein-S-isoprenylcysteine O-methyltransferase Ste14